MKLPFKKDSFKDVNWKRVSITIIIFSLIISGGMFYNSKFKPEELEYNDFLTMVDENKIESIEIINGSDILLIASKNSEKFYTSNPESDTFKEDMLKSGIEVSSRSSRVSVLTVVTANLFQFALFGLILAIFINFARGTFQKKDSIVDEKVNVTFEDIAGSYEAKEDMKFLVNFLENPEKYENMGAKLPKGVVLYGPPGTGKTLMARAVAGEADVPFFYASGSDFMEMYVGLGAKRVRDLFEQAKENSPSIIFIDEIDAVGTSRGGSQNSEKDQTINALLAELDGFSAGKPVIVMAATNRLEDLDEALIRPGRFDRHVNIGLPDQKERLAILNNYAKDKKLEDDIDLDSLANITIGFSGASLEALMNEAAIIAVNRESTVINSADIDDSYFKIAMKGNKKVSKNPDLKEVELVAYHEAGHALATRLLTDNHLHKVTIIPSTSGAGGATFSVPKTISLISKREIINSIIVLYAGRAAEEILKGNKDDVTSGASADIQQATGRIKAYFSQLGMSEKFGMMAIENEDLYMDEAVKLSNELYEETLVLLKENRDLLDVIAEGLIKNETLTGKEVDELMGLESEE